VPDAPALLLCQEGLVSEDGVDGAGELSFEAADRFAAALAFALLAFEVGASGRADAALPGSYQVTLDGLGKAAATQRWNVSPRATFGNRVSRRQPELSNPHQTDTPSA
jgi:hypothetical protein